MNIQLRRSSFPRSVLIIPTQPWLSSPLLATSRLLREKLSISLSLYIYAHIYIYIYTYVYDYIYIYIYIYLYAVSGQRVSSQAVSSQAASRERHLSLGRDAEGLRGSAWEIPLEGFSDMFPREQTRRVCAAQDFRMARLRGKSPHGSLNRKGIASAKSRIRRILPMNLSSHLSTFPSGRLPTPLQLCLPICLPSYW